MITYDSVTDGGYFVLNNSFNHTIGAGANPYLFVGIIGGFASSVDYGGTPLSLLVSINQGSAQVALWGLANPPTGSLNVNVFFSTVAPNPNRYQAMAISYLGVGGVETTNTLGQPSQFHIAISTTTISNNSWALMMGVAQNTTINGTYTADAGTTIRAFSNSGLGSDVQQAFLADTNGPISPPGSVTLGATSNIGLNAAVIVSFNDSVFVPQVLII